MSKLTAADCETFRRFVANEEAKRYMTQYPDTWKTVHARAWKTTATERRKYVAIDVGSSGRFLVDRATGDIWGIKAYGKRHDGYHYGTLETPEHWPSTAQYANGGGFVPLSKLHPPIAAAAAGPDLALSKTLAEKADLFGVSDEEPIEVTASVRAENPVTPDDFVAELFPEGHGAPFPNESAGDVVKSAARLAIDLRGAAGADFEDFGSAADTPRKLNVRYSEGPDPSAAVDETAGQAERLWTREQVIELIAQAVINIEAGITTIERGSPIYQALVTFIYFDANDLRGHQYLQEAINEIAGGICCGGCEPDSASCDVGRAKDAQRYAKEARV